MKKESRKELISFISYCLEHPDERFWQALRNWSQYYFIFAWRPRKPLTMKDDGGHQVDGLEEMLKKTGLEDTFYWD